MPLAINTIDHLNKLDLGEDALEQIRAQIAPTPAPTRPLIDRMREEQDAIIRRNADRRPATEAKPTTPAPTPATATSISVKGHPLIAACYLSSLRFGEAKVTYRPDQQRVFVEIDINMLWIADLRRHVARYRVGASYGNTYPIPALTTPELLKILDISRKG